MNYVIVTGASKGLGEAVVKALLKPDYHLICVARSSNNQLLETAEKNNVKLDYIQFDLSDVSNVATLVQTIFSKIDKSNINSISFINNAGMLDPMKPMEKCEPEEITTNLQVNLVTPMILVSEFMKNTAQLDVEKRIINVSSGAGKNPIFGWGCYGASKAGIDLFSQTIGIEESNKQYPVKVTSFAPGIIDTNMQQQIRSTTVENFSQVDKFIDYKEQGMLLQPETVAQVIVKLLTTSEFPNGKLSRVQDYL
ncbi:(S)-benzoin forming benzil reductase [Evansella sp. AB-rgal1]|uniref:(S)-benzoin forming benzil reductase n=1 Tax=Evansella sp. AB-rgal1 TaxID=3242696 RepID=UPI00359D63A3